MCGICGKVLRPISKNSYNHGGRIKAPAPTPTSVIKILKKDMRVRRRAAGGWILCCILRYSNRLWRFTGLGAWGLLWFALIWSCFGSVWFLPFWPFCHFAIWPLSFCGGFGQCNSKNMKCIALMLGPPTPPGYRLQATCKKDIHLYPSPFIYLFSVVLRFIWTLCTLTAVYCGSDATI